MEEVGNPYTAPRAQVQQAMDSHGQAKADRSTRMDADPIDASVHGVCLGPGHTGRVAVFGDDKRCLHDMMADTIALAA